MPVVRKRFPSKSPSPRQWDATAGRLPYLPTDLIRMNRCQWFRSVPKTTADLGFRVFNYRPFPVVSGSLVYPVCTNRALRLPHLERAALSEFVRSPGCQMVKFVSANRFVASRRKRGRHSGVLRNHTLRDRPVEETRRGIQLRKRAGHTSAPLQTSRHETDRVEFRERCVRDRSRGL